MVIVLGLFLPALYGFAGGDAEWQLSGGSRLTLSQRVIELTLRNPITGLGPSAYRPYGVMQPLFYQGAYWIEPRISSHNNYVDIVAQTGLLGLLCFAWLFCGRRLVRCRCKLNRRYPCPFHRQRI